MNNYPITYKQAIKLVSISELQKALRQVRALTNGDHCGDLLLLPGGAKLAVKMRPGKRISYMVKGYARDGSDIKRLNLR